MIRSHADLAKFTAKLIRETMEFGEFIHSQNVDEYGTVVLTTMKHIEDILESDYPMFPKPFLTEMEERISEYFLQWNGKIEKQVRMFYDLYKTIEQKSKIPFASFDNHPFKEIMNNLKRYDSADKKIQKIIKKYELKAVDEIEFYSMFFAIILMSEAEEYYFRKDLRSQLDKYKIENVDLDEMFSLGEKWIQKNGNYVSDIRGIRNAVSHFNFDIEFDEEDVNFIITFCGNPEGKEETKIMKGNELVDCLGHYRYMLQTFEHMLFLLFIFSMLKQFFSEDAFMCDIHGFFPPETKSCPTCSK